ncbi:MAG: hypothetical protein PHD72_03015 [Patescibacteria group bacterium]|nr:hypothetical protein [Patescibacteria group bacterium]
MASTNKAIKEISSDLGAIRKLIDLWSFNIGASGSKNNFSVCEIRDEFIRLSFKLHDKFGGELPPNIAQPYFFHKTGADMSIVDSQPARELMDNILHEIDKITAFLSSLNKQNSPAPTMNRIVYKDENGNFYYKGCRVEIPNTNACYYKVFDIIYTQAPRGGEVTFAKILKDLTQRGVAECNEKTIRNAISEHQGLFRYVEDIKNKTMSGGPLLKTGGRNKSVLFVNEIFS